MADLFVYILIGSISGIVMGTVGVGGGAIIIFSLLYIAHFPQVKQPPRRAWKIGLSCCK